MEKKAIDIVVIICYIHISPTKEEKVKSKKISVLYMICGLALFFGTLWFVTKSEPVQDNPVASEATIEETLPVQKTDPIRIKKEGKPEFSEVKNHTPSLQRVMNNQNNGEYFKFRSDFGSLTGAGNAFDQKSVTDLKNILHRMMRTHPAKKVHYDFYQLLADGEIALVFDLDLRANAAFSIQDFANIKKKACFVVNPRHLLGPNSTPQSVKLTLYHEYLHYLQYKDGAFPDDQFNRKTGKIEDLKKVVQWIESEFHAHEQTTEFGLRQGWTAENEGMMAYEVGARNALILFHSNHKSELRDQAQMFSQSVSKHGSKGAAMFFTELFWGSKSKDKRLSDYRNQLLVGARRALKKYIAETYSQSPWLTEEGMSFVKQLGSKL